MGNKASQPFADVAKKAVSRRPDPGAFDSMAARPLNAAKQIFENGEEASKKGQTKVQNNSQMQSTDLDPAILKEMSRWTMIKTSNSKEVRIVPQLVVVSQFKKFKFHSHPAPPLSQLAR